MRQALCERHALTALWHRVLRRGRSAPKVSRLFIVCTFFPPFRPCRRQESDFTGKWKETALCLALSLSLKLTMFVIMLGTNKAVRLGIVIFITSEQAL